MTENHPTQPPLVTSPYLPPAPRPPVRKRRWFAKPAVLIPAAALLVGLGMGAAATPEPKVETVTVPGPERIVTKTVEVKVTPPECITALDLAGSAIGTLGEIGGLASDGILAAYNRNGPALEAVTGKVNVLNQKITDATPAIGTATRACRASAK